ncbi:adenosine deaminase-like protein [Schistocerca piceifrons]|uniref:adenosine deaminase-like protein n=1 Tax=Schistocerca piceifrons TaxID=274613 RepID=UPI001F5EDA6E|nr:adenosine deaminase-like protein [Schistocerca piceifrons]
MDVATFCRELPKLELHAHLNGSLSSRTLNALRQLQNSSDASGDSWKKCEAIINHGNERTLDECFQLFSVVHSLTSTPTAVSKATDDVIEEFEEDGVIYLELRSTPRCIDGIMTKEQYVEAIVKSIRKANISRNILTKLIVSVDRQRGLTEAEENVLLAVDMHFKYPDIVVGIDLSGHPCKGRIEDFLPLLQKARSSGLKLSLHCAEVPNVDEVEKILKFKPHRIGHGTCIHPNFGGSEKLWNMLSKSGIPVEVCLTSNLKTKTIEGYEKSHLGPLLEQNIPVVLSTDDKGVFATTLSEECRIAAETFSLTRMWMCEAMLRSVSYTFTTEDEKNKLVHSIHKFMNSSECS